MRGHPARGPGGRGRDAGFTLIELLVVLVIIGIILGFASISFDGGGLERRAEQEVQRLAALIRLYRQEGILNNRQLALRVLPDRYQFLRLEGEQWQPVEGDLVFRERILPDGLRMEMEDMEGTPEEGEEGVMLFFLSSGEVTPFELRVKVGEETDWVLLGDPWGGLEARSSRDRDFAQWLADRGR